MVPNVNLNGRQSKILVTDYQLGSNALLYSTAEILTYGMFDVEVLVLYLDEGQGGQFAFRGTSNNLTYETYGSSSVSTFTSNGVQAFSYTQAAGQTVLKFSHGVLVYLLDRPSAWSFWAPPTTTNPQVSATEHIFVLGTYLVRSATVSNGSVHVSGDTNVTTRIEIYTGNPSIQTIAWNGIRLPVTKTAYGSVTATIAGPENRTINLPTLTDWDSADSLPEKDPAFDDSRWIICNKTTTLSPVAPLTLPVLFASDYGFYVGIKVYRGYFDGKAATGVNLTVSGGLAFGWNAWLNGVLIGGFNGNANVTTDSRILGFPTGTNSSVLKPKGNVLTVLVDYTGHDESSAYGLENPRGILGAALVGPSHADFWLWKMQGNAGGDGYIDPVRGPMNEGGLYGERLGWHLPSVPRSQFSSTSSPLTGLTAAGVAWYRTTFVLDLDSDLDVPLGVALSAPANSTVRVQVFVNGYQYGKFFPSVGPQTVFPVPPGVVNNGGPNTLSLSLWAQDAGGGRLDAVTLVKYGVYGTGFGFDRDWSYLQPGWDESRLRYN